jgi:hypothetical protein
MDKYEIIIIYSCEKHFLEMAQKNGLVVFGSLTIF